MRFLDSGCDLGHVWSAWLWEETTLHILLGKSTY
jgi:hypothetical protein